MQRGHSFPLSLERLEERCVLSAESPYQIVMPASVAAIVSKAEAEVQQAEVHFQQKASDDVKVADTAQAALDQSSGGSNGGISTPLNPGNGGGTTIAENPPPANTPSSAPPGGVTHVGSVGAQGSSGQTSSNLPSQTQTLGGQNPSTSQENPTAPATPSAPTAAGTTVSSNPPREVSSVSGSESPTVQSGLTATPTQQQLGQGGAATLTPQANSSVTTDQSASSATVGRDGTVVVGQAIGIAQPATPSLNERFANAADGAGTAFGYSVGDSRPTTGLPLRRADGRYDDSALEISAPTLLAADLLSGAAPQDAASLDAGIRQFLGQLGQLEDLGREVTHSLRESSVAVWLAAAALGAVGIEFARRRRRALLARGSAGAAEHAADSWVPGLSGPLGSDQL
jgi:hypothetical protein